MVQWYKLCDREDVTIRVLINGVYTWIVATKRFMRQLASDASQSSIILHLLRCVPAGCGDGVLDFHFDVEKTLKEQVALCDAPLFSVLLIAQPCACAMEDMLFELDEAGLDSLQPSISDVLRFAYSMSDGFTVN
jgi:hypothetical protein